MYLKEKTDQKPASPRYVLILPSQPLHVMIQLPVNKRGSRWNGGSQWLTVNGNSQHNEMNFSSCKTQIFRIQQPAQEKGTYYKKQPLYSHSKKFCPGNFFNYHFFRLTTDETLSVEFSFPLLRQSYITTLDIKIFQVPLMRCNLRTVKHTLQTVYPFCWSLIIRSVRIDTWRIRTVMVQVYWTTLKHQLSDYLKKSATVNLEWKG